MLAVVALAGGAGAAAKSYRVFFKGNLRAGGAIQADGSAHFDTLRIGTPREPLAGGVQFFVRTGNGRTLDSTDLEPETIAALAIAKEDLPRNSEWGPGAVEYSFEGMAFVFREGHCLSFRASLIQLPNRAHRPEIGTAEAGAFYRLPLTQPQLETLFGPPDRVEDRASL
ncbi:MAG TPA: hypothetical protein VL200_14315 [Lacunisphaera sp.]|jgi:hypothetical protein|nr:hypothetical protein [Lacunisphaera sp.]